MNKIATISFIMPLLSLILFFILGGPNASLQLMIIVPSAFSLIGIILAALCGKWLPGILSVLVNGAVLVYSFSILLSYGTAA